MFVRLDRDSVAAGDDVEAHALDVVVDERRPLVLVVRDITRDRYLLRIQGGRATWIVRTARQGPALGVISQRWGAWKDAELLIDPSDDVASAGSSLFEHRAQQEAAATLDELRSRR